MLFLICWSWKRCIKSFFLFTHSFFLLPRVIFLSFIPSPLQDLASIPADDFRFVFHLHSPHWSCLDSLAQIPFSMCFSLRLYLPNSQQCGRNTGSSLIGSARHVSSPRNSVFSCCFAFDFGRRGYGDAYSGSLGEMKARITGVDGKGNWTKNGHFLTQHISMENFMSYVTLVSVNFHGRISFCVFSYFYGFANVIAISCEPNLSDKYFYGYSLGQIYICN